MSTAGDRTREIARAVLYEGYVLWPYRRTALKNHKRWTFGGIHPPAWSEAGHADDRCVMRAEVLVRATARAQATVDITFRWLQVIERRIGRGQGSEIRFVDRLEMNGERYVPWDEATEREIILSLPLANRACRSASIRIAAGSDTELLMAHDGSAVGTVERRWRALAGIMVASADRLGPGTLRVRVEVHNGTRWHGRDRDDALRSSFNSSHLVLRSGAARFVSLTDPPRSLARAAAQCDNVGCWPVLAGEPGQCDTMLAAPIILADYPAVAPESPGDLFDGGEIDELLVLNILGLSDSEKADMRSADPRTREILERTEALTPEQLLRLHGTFRDIR